MEIKVDDLLNFCAYFQLSQLATQLPHQPLPPSRKKIPEVTKSIKMTRKKFEGAEPKKVARPKMEHVSTNNKAKHSVSPIHRTEIKELQQDHNKPLDLNYFVSHLTSQAPTNNWQEPLKKTYQQSYQYGKKNESNLHNYETFGRSANRVDYETFQQKMRRDKDNRGNLTERYERNDKPDYTVSQFALRPEQKQSGILENNSWIIPAQNAYEKTFKSQFIDIDRKKQEYSGPIFEQLNYQQAESKVSYSPNTRRQYTPTNSNISKYSPDSHLSKSRSKNQRKKSERPFYDASKLSIKKENQSVVRDSNGEQSNLSQSFVTTQDPFPGYVKRQEKRETSTTAPPLRGNNNSNSRSPKPIYRIDPSQIELDDALGDTLTELSHRRVPVAFDLRLKSDI